MEPDLVPENLLQQISEYVAEKIGLHFPRARWTDLQRGLAGAVKELGFSDLSTGAESLLSAPLSKAELDVLVTHLTIGETYFFRDKKSFTVLREKILPQMIRARQSGTRCLRIWSAACCTGEEAYSLAIVLHELIPQLTDWHVTILATDINVRFLTRAMAGTYRDWAFRDTPGWIKQRYFRPAADGSYVILPEIKRLVTFVELNLVEDAFPSLVGGTNAMDLILCRNMLMYFSPEQARKVVSNLHRSLVDEGWLLVSPNETSQVLFKQFETVNFPSVILYRKGGARSLKNQTSTNAPIQQTTDVLTCTNVSASAEEIVQNDPEADSKTFSLLTRALADQGKLQDALVWCDRWVQQDKLDPLAHYLRAIVLQELGDTEQARRSFQASIYINPGFVLAHFALGNLARSQKKFGEARKHLAAALSLLRKYQAEDVLPESDGLTAGRLIEIITSITDGEETLRRTQR